MPLFELTDFFVFVSKKKNICDSLRLGSSDVEGCRPLSQTKAAQYVRKSVNAQKNDRRPGVISVLLFVQI